MKTLRDELVLARVVVTCGPGGVGKTTCAAALGVAVARTTERRVLVVTIDPARRLADALGLSSIGNDATKVEGFVGRGELSVAMLDTKASWDALIRRHAPDDSTAQRILRNTLYQNITGRFIQSHDYIAMERLHEFVEEDCYDLIVVDTPPTRNALDFLDAPSRMAEFFSSRLLRWLIAPTRSGVVGFAARPFSQIADRILGGQFVRDITEFFLLLNTMYAGFVQRAREVQVLLEMPSTVFVVVSTLESVPVAEATFFVDELRHRKLSVGGWILNRVLPTTLSDPRLDEALEELDSASLAGVERTLEVDSDSLQRVRRALIDNVTAWRTVAHHEQTQLRQLSARGLALYCAPSLEDEINELAGLQRLGDILLTSSGVVES